MAVGGALSNWSLVELRLSSLFEALSDMPDQNKAAVVFPSIRSFDSRLAVCDRLMKFEAIDELTAEMWVKMSAKLSKFYGKRHELAHFSIHWDKASAPTISPFLTFDKLATDSLRHLTAGQVRERSRKFIDLHLAIGWFATEALWRRVKSHEGPRPENAEPPLVQRIRELAIQSLEERKRQNSPLQA